MLIAYYRLFETFRLLSVTSDRKTMQTTQNSRPGIRDGCLCFCGYTAKKNFTRNSREMA